MGTGFSWLNDLMVWLAKWVPRIVLVKAGEVGLLFMRGGRTAVCAPGLHTYWPITSDLQVVSAKRRTIEMSGQVHDREVIALVIVFRVASAVAILHWNNIPANIDDRSAAHLARAYRAEASSTAIAADVLDAMRREWEPTGVDIEAVDIAQRGPIRTFRLMKDWATHEAATL